MAEEPRHLPWEQVADLSARLAAVPIFERPSPASFESEVLRRFFEPSRQEGAAPTVSEDLLARYEKARRHVATLDPKSRKALSRPMANLLTSVKGMECADCAFQGSGHLCLGKDEAKDDAQLAHPGLCIKLLHDLFRDVMTRYGAIVDQWAFDSDVTRRSDLEVYLSTRAQAESAYDRAGPEWKICGSTRFRDEMAGRKSEVKLSIAIDTLDWTSLCATFWILVHEFICHSQQGRSTANRRKPCHPSCPFFEGWMDEVAMRILLSDLDAGLFSDGRSEFVTQHAGELLQAASDFRCNRYGWAPGAPRHKYGPRWDLGVKAARVIDEFLQRFDADQNRASPRRALEPLVRLSFRLLGFAPEPDLGARIVSWLLVAPHSARRAGRRAEARLFDLLTGQISDFPYWISQLSSIAELRDM